MKAVAVLIIYVIITLFYLHTSISFHDTVGRYLFAFQSAVGGEG